MELKKIELKRMKVVENREEPLRTHFQEDATYYVRNNEENRSRRNNWKPKSYVRSSSRPGFYRTASRNSYERDNSSFRRDFNRNRSQFGGRFTGAGKKAQQGDRNKSKSQERPKSEMFKMIENQQKEIGEIKKQMEKMTKMMESKLMNTQFVEEELTVDVMYVNEGTPKMMLIDSGAPKSVVSKEWIEGYLKIWM